MVRLLLSQRADPNQTDNVAGNSAIDYARQDTRAAAILRELEQPRRGAACRRRRPTELAQSSPARPGSRSPASRRAARRAKRRVSALRRAAASGRQRRLADISAS